MLEKKSKSSEISPIFARFALHYLQKRNVDETLLFKGTELSRVRLETGGDIKVKDFVTFLTNGSALTDDEALGIAIAKRINVITLGSIGGAMTAAPTIREGLQILENFVRLHVSYIKVELHAGPTSLSVRVIFLEELGDLAERIHAEASVCQIQDYVEMITGEPLINAEYRFRFPQPVYADRYAQILHSKISYCSDVHAAELEAEVLDESSPYYDAIAWDTTRKQLAMELKSKSSEQPGVYSEHVRAFLKSQQPPLPELAIAADRMHLSERSLNRRLQEEGTNFRSLKGQILRSWAQQYLIDTNISVESIGAALGYRDTANFRRAFRHWEGCSPIDYRVRMRS